MINTLDQHRSAFELCVYSRYLSERRKRLLRDDIDPAQERAHTKEEVCWRNEAGVYGVAQVRHAWEGYQMALGIEPL